MEDDRAALKAKARGNKEAVQLWKLLEEDKSKLIIEKIDLQRQIADQRQHLEKDESEQRSVYQQQLELFAEELKGCELMKSELETKLMGTQEELENLRQSQDTCMQENVRLRKVLKKQQAEVEKAVNANARADSAEAQLQRAKAEQNELREAVMWWGREKAELLKEVEHFKGQLASERSRFQTAQAEMEEKRRSLQEKTEQLIGRAQAAENANSILVEEKQNLEMTLDEERSRLSEVSSLLQEQSKVTDRVHQDIKTLKETEVNTKERLENDLKSAQDEALRLRGEKKAWVRERIQREKQYRLLLDQFQGKLDEVQRMEAQLRQSTDLVSDLRAQMQRERARESDADAEISRLGSKITRQEAIIDELRAELKTASGEGLERYQEREKALTSQLEKITKQLKRVQESVVTKVEAVSSPRDLPFVSSPVTPTPGASGSSKPSDSPSTPDSSTSRRRNKKSSKGSSGKKKPAAGRALVSEFEKSERSKSPADTRSKPPDAVQPPGSGSQVVKRIATLVAFFAAFFACMASGSMGAAVLYTALSTALILEFRSPIIAVPAASTFSKIGIAWTCLFCLVSTLYTDVRSPVHVLGALVVYPLGGVALVLIACLAATLKGKCTAPQFTGFAYQQFGMLWGPWMLVFLLELYLSGSRGRVLTTLIIVLVELGDVFQYIGGRLSTSYHLPVLSTCPFASISPSKSVGGYIAGVVGTILLASYLEICSASFALVIAVLGMAGDLLVSCWKRVHRLKDSGNFLPGHGGFWDRLDSLVLVAPAVFMYYSDIILTVNAQQ